MKKLVIVGAGGHGAVAADIATLLGYDPIVFLDDAAEKGCLDFPLVGKVSAYASYLKGWEFFVAIGNSRVRENLQTRLEQDGAKMAVLVHPKAVIGSDVTLGNGTIVMAGAVVNARTRIAEGVILNTCCSADHDNTIGAFSHIAVGAHLCGNVTIGTRTWIGAGAVVINNVTVTNDCIIGAGGVVTKNIEESGTYIGIPVKRKRDSL